MTESQHPRGIREKFRKEVAKAEADINLAYAALLFSEYLTGPFDTSLYLTLLDEIGQTLAASLNTTKNRSAVIKEFNHYIFKELKFTGNIKNYYHPHNSYLNRVLDLRMGIPISLSLIYLEVGWRLGLQLWGIGLPGHFIVGYGSIDDPIYIDVFGQGRILSEDECVALSQGRVTNRQEIKEKYLKPVPKKAILYRMLLNLKQIFVGLEYWETAYNVVDLMLQIYPQHLNERRDRGLIAYRLDRLMTATIDIERYLFLAPNSPDSEWLNQHLEMMEQKLLRLN